MHDVITVDTAGARAGVDVFLHKEGSQSGEGQHHHIPTGRGCNSHWCLSVRQSLVSVSETITGVCQ